MRFIGLKGLAAAVLLCWSGAAVAGTTTNLGVVSEYLLRGIEGSDGIAVQGGMDWSGDSGVYLGTWASELGGPAKVGDFELDAYGGWAGQLGAMTLDLGAVYYTYPQDEMNPDYDYPEVYAKLGLGALALQAYYATDFYGDAIEAAADLAGKDNDGFYANAVVTLPLTDDVSLVAQAGHSSGDGVEVAYGDRYADYGIALTQTYEGSVTLTLGVYNTTLEGDGLKVVAGLKQTVGP